MFCSIFPPKAPFSKHSRFVIFSCLFFFFYLPFQHSMFLFLSFISPFWDNILVLFLWLYLCCPFPFFVSASFLPTSFLPSPSPIHLAFIFGRFTLLFFLFACYCFQVWCFLLFSCWFLFGFLLTVVVPFIRITGNFCFLLSKCGVGCCGFRLMT